jgi:hypothetical protein
VALPLQPEGRGANGLVVGDVPQPGGRDQLRVWTHDLGDAVGDLRRRLPLRPVLPVEQPEVERATAGTGQRPLVLGESLAHPRSAVAAAVSRSHHATRDASGGAVKTLITRTSPGPVSSRQQESTASSGAVRARRSARTTRVATARQPSVKRPSGAIGGRLTQVQRR